VETRDGLQHYPGDLNSGTDVTVPQPVTALY
jgi:hypothetical protein